MGIGSNIGKALLAQAPNMAPGAAVSLLRSIVGFAIDGVSGLPVSYTHLTLPTILRV